MGSRPSRFTLTSSGPLRLYSTVELLAMPAPEWLITPIMPLGALVGVYGAPETMKSFLAIDVALSVATGTDWQGHLTQKGYVVYIGAEGGAGLGKRALAWLTTHDIDPKDADIAWLIESVPLSTDSDGMTVLLERLENEVQREPTMIVVDTLARCFDGNENEQEDMGLFIAAVDMLRKRFNCTVVIVHHTRLDGSRERGGTSFRAGVDTMIAIERDGDAIDVKCTKQKDAEHFEDIQLEKRVVEGTDSCVLVAGAATRHATQADELWQVLQGLEPCSWDTWVGASGLMTGPFMKVFKRLKGRTKKGHDGLWRTV